MTLPIHFDQTLSQIGVSAFQYYETIGSTNQAALEWLQQGAPDQAIVFADHQSSGKGRLSRTWVTNPGCAVAVSVIFKPTPEEKALSYLFSPLAGVALADLLRKRFHLEAEIKWPNDVLINEAKTAGILSEAYWEGDLLNGIVLGIGINITAQSLPPLKNLQYPATCIQNHVDTPIDRFQFLAQFLQSLFNWRKNLTKPIFFNSWEKLLAFRDKNVYIKGNDGSTICSGFVHGILPNGDLQIRTEGQEIKTFTVGDVHLRQKQVK
jgi:BirA family biotin operon repressor/biotin-[acetyl-CoA-carboxylase] ligase